MTKYFNDSHERSRTLLGKIATAAAVVIILTAFMSNFGLLDLWDPWAPQHTVYGLTALSLVCVFILRPLFKQMPVRFVVVDGVLAALGFLGFVYVAWFWVDLRYPGISHSTLSLATSIGIILLLLEALRRIAGWRWPVVVTLFLLYAIFADVMPRAVMGLPLDFPGDFPKILFYDNNLSHHWVDKILDVFLPVIFLAYWMLPFGGGRFIVDFGRAILGAWRGGPAKSAVLVSAGFGAVSGNAETNTLVTDAFTIPAMRAAGYSRVHAAAVEATASAGGTLILGLSAYFFLYPELWSLGAYGVALLIPAFLYFYVLFLQVHLIAAKSGTQRSAPPATALRDILERGWHFLVPPLILLGCLFLLNLPLVWSSLAAALFLGITGFLRPYGKERPDFSIVVTSVVRFGVFAAGLIVLVFSAGLIGSVLTETRLAMSLSVIFPDPVVSGGSALAVMGGLVVAAIFGLVAGMILGPWLVAAVLVPMIAIQGGGTLGNLETYVFVSYFIILGTLSPPLGLTSYTAALMAEADPVRVAWRAMRLNGLAYVLPFVIIFTPPLLLEGGPQDIALGIIATMAGLYFLSVGARRHCFGPLSRQTGILFVLAGALGLLPAHLVSYLNFIPLTAGLFLLLDECRRTRQTA